jgi:hypothetical protein
MAATNTDAIRRTENSLQMMDRRALAAPLSAENAMVLAMPVAA